MEIGDPGAAHAGKEISRLWLTAALIYFLAAASTIALTSNGRDIATVWPANAVLVALLLADARPRWGTVLSAGFIANVAANLVTRGSLAGPILYSIANLLEVGLAVWLLQVSISRDALLQSTGAVMRFIVVAGLLAPIASGVLGSLTAFMVFSEPLRKSFTTWVASDGLGLLVFTPFCLAAVRGDFVTCFMLKTWRQRIESAGLLATVGLVTYYVFFSTPRPLLFTVFPPLMLVTFRIGRLGTKAGVMLVAIIGGLATMHGHGPVVLLSDDPGTQAQLFQAFLAVTLLTCLPVAAEVTARARLTAALAAHDQEMTTSAITDPLTGILNRGGFEGAAAKLLQSEPAGSISLIAIDFDHFKAINDRWGHIAGDLALKHVTSTMQMHVRGRDLVGRTGGDEFMVLLSDSDQKLAKAVAERIRAAVHASPLAVDEKSTALITLSMGAASSRPGDTYEQLAERADRAPYAAKNAGRNSVQTAA